MTTKSKTQGSAAAHPDGPNDGAPRPPSTAITALEQQLVLMFATARTMMRDRAVSVHPDLSPGAYNVLGMLVRSGPQHAGALAAALYADKSVISRIVRQLAHLGLVERRADPTDGRAFFIAATPLAVHRVDAVRDAHRSALHHFLAGWDESDIAQLTALLARLNTLRPDAGIVSS